MGRWELYRASRSETQSVRESDLGSEVDSQARVNRSKEREGEAYAHLTDPKSERARASAELGAKWAEKSTESGESLPLSRSPFSAIGSFLHAHLTFRSSLFPANHIALPARGNSARVCRTCRRLTSRLTTKDPSLSSRSITPSRQTAKMTLTLASTSATLARLDRRLTQALKSISVGVCLIYFSMWLHHHYVTPHVKAPTLDVSPPALLPPS